MLKEYQGNSDFLMNFSLISNISGIKIWLSLLSGSEM